MVPDSVETPQDVTDWVERIRVMADDDESAHSEEDSLHRAILRAIADGTATDPVEMCRLGLTTREIQFRRWCA